MTSKTIKNEQWYVKDLVARIDNGEICKPKFQRKRKWDILPKKDTDPSERNYIDFLRETKNSVHPITFGLSNGKYTNIDGNNRINAICHFVKSPFNIYPENYELITTYIDILKTQSEEIPQNIISKLCDIFKQMSYFDIINFKNLKRYFTEIIKEPELYNHYLKPKNDEFEPIIEELQKRITNGNDRFDLNVTINVNIFEGYLTEELCNMFAKINKHTSALTAKELLASTLFTKNNFIIKDKMFDMELRKILAQNYTKLHNCEGESLQLYNFDEKADINAYDFIIGTELLMFNRCKIFNNKNLGATVTGLSLLFKVFNAIYGGINDEFNTDNINDFIYKITRAIEICKKLESLIAIEDITTISNKTFDKCHKTLTSLNTNSQVILLLGIIGNVNNSSISDKEICYSVIKCLLGHLFIRCVKSKENREKYYKYDLLSLDNTSGKWVRELFTKIYKEPSLLNTKINKPIMSEIIDILLSENIANAAVDSAKHRKSRKFWEGILIQSYFNIKMPLLFLNKSYWIEHIFPFSSTIDGNTFIDIDRLGNIIPIIAEINNTRGAKHINEYSKTPFGKDFIKHLSEIIPPVRTYDRIITHNETSTPRIINTTAYSELCSANEKTYRDTFLAQLFPN